MTMREWSTPRISQSRRLTRALRGLNPRDLSEDRAAELDKKYQRESADLKIRKAGRPRPTICEVCGASSKRICFDHCHTSGQFRGWLCSGCNSALGMVKDNAETLRRLADYLVKSRQ